MDICNQEKIYLNIMKIILASTLLLLLLLPQSVNFDLLLHKWKKVGTKDFGKEYQATNNSLGEILTIKDDGTYQQVIYGQMKFSGNWKYDRVKSKLAFAVTEMNGKVMFSMSINEVKPTDSIVRLTTDTLIKASLKYYGPKKVYGHDDTYYVRVN